MQTWTDADGAEWRLEITGATVKRCLADEALAVDLGKPDVGDPPLITRFDLDFALKIDLIHAACFDQCQRDRIEPADFARRLQGDALAQANQAFLKEWADFFRPLRPDLAKVIEAAQEMTRHLYEVKAEKLEGEPFRTAVKKASGAYSRALEKTLANVDTEIERALGTPGN
jgi:hypothetical protein